MAKPLTGSAKNDFAATSEDVGISIDVLANDSLPARGTWTVAIETAPQHGQLIPLGAGRFRYEPQPDSTNGPNGHVRAPG